MPMALASGYTPVDTFFGAPYVDIDEQPHLVFHAAALKFIDPVTKALIDVQTLTRAPHNIGTLYLLFAIVAGVIGGLLSVLMRMQLMHPANESSNAGN